MSVFPTLVWGGLSETGTGCDFTSHHMILLFARLQHKVRLLVSRLSKSEIGLDATSPIPASGVLLLHRDGLGLPKRRLTEQWLGALPLASLASLCLSSPRTMG